MLEQKFCQLNDLPSPVFWPFPDHYSYLIFGIKFTVTKENLLAFISTKDQMGVVMGGLSQESFLLRFDPMPRPEMDWIKREVITARADVSMAQSDSGVKAGLEGFHLS